MIDSIKTFGDSFMYGSDLSDCDGTGMDNWSQLTWPALIAKDLDLTYDCFAQGARGNQFIAEWVIGQATNNSLVIINWSWIDRFDVHIVKGKVTTLMPGDDNTTALTYYKNLHSELNDKIRNLMFIHSTHCYLKNHNIPFISTLMDKLLFDTQWNTNPMIIRLQEQLQDDIVYFPDNQTFLEWSRANSYPESDNWHPLEQAHQVAADIWLPIYKKAINTHINNLKD